MELNFSMNDSVISTIRIAVSVIVTAALIIISTIATNRARLLNIDRETQSAAFREMYDERQWRKYEGTVTGADVIDFIVTHKDSCDIVICGTFTNKISSYVRNGKLIMGLSDKLNLPDIFWTASFAYDYIIDGKGEKKYKAVLLYDGALSSAENGSEAITGIEFTSL